MCITPCSRSSALYFPTEFPGCLLGQQTRHPAGVHEVGEVSARLGGADDDAIIETNCLCLTFITENMNDLIQNKNFQH